MWDVSLAHGLSGTEHLTHISTGVSGWDPEWARAPILTLSHWPILEVGFVQTWGVVGRVWYPFAHASQPLPCMALSPVQLQVGWGGGKEQP